MAQPTQERLASQLEKPMQTSGNVGHAGSHVGPEDAPHFQDHEDDHTHHVSMKTYYIIFTLLMFLLFITVGAWYFDQHVRPLGKLSTPIAMAIAVAKAVAIVLFFMHVKFASKLVQIFACTGVVFMGILFMLTFNDYGTRPWLPQSGVYTPSTAANSMGNNSERSGEIIRSSSVGSAPNSQTAPTDSTVGNAQNAPGNANQTAIDGARDRGGAVTGIVNGGALPPPRSGGGTRGATNMGAALSDPNSALNQTNMSASNTRTSGGTAGTTGTQQSGAGGASGMGAGRANTALSGSTQSEGPIIGGAANNVYGSEPQSQGIQPRRVAPAAKTIRGTNPVTKPKTAAERPPSAPAATR